MNNLLFTYHFSEKINKRQIFLDLLLMILFPLAFIFRLFAKKIRTKSKLLSSAVTTIDRGSPKPDRPLFLGHERSYGEGADDEYD